MHTALGGGAHIYASGPFRPLQLARLLADQKVEGDAYGPYLGGLWDADCAL